MQCLSKLSQIAHLELADNGINSILPFLALTNLRYLGLKNNRIKCIRPLFFHPKLRERSLFFRPEPKSLVIDVRRNPLDETSLSILKLGGLENRGAEILYDKEKV